MGYTYFDEHSVLEKESLDRGSQVREELEKLDLSPEEFDHILNLKLDYVYARIPTEFWEGEAPSRIPRLLLKEINNYIANSNTMHRYGLGLSLISMRFNSKLPALYYLCAELVRQGYKCFAIPYIQLVRLFRESREDVLLKSEITERFKADFFFLLDIPEIDDLTNYVQQDFFASLELRLTGERPVLFSANTNITSLNELMPDSLLGRLLPHFARSNKLIKVEDNTDLDTLSEDKWNQFVNSGGGS